MATAKLPRLFSQMFIRRYGCEVRDLKQIMADKIPCELERMKKFQKQCKNVTVGNLTVNMIFKGMRGVVGLISDISLLDADQGIRFRGYSIPELEVELPKGPGGLQPLPEAIFWLMLTGEIPTYEETTWLSQEWARRAQLPDYVYKILNNFPVDTHPMTQLSCALSSLNRESSFAKAYTRGIRKNQYWEYTFDDAMDLIARIPVIASIIYRNIYKNKSKVPPPDLDAHWALNFACMIGCESDDCIEMLKLYLTIHSDHEGGNVTAHTSHTVASSLSDVYLSYASGLNGLAGPLHGRATQEVLDWLTTLQKEFGKEVTDNQLKAFIKKTLVAGKIIPGYGHAVLRKTDPRFLSIQKFCQTHFPDDPLFKLVSQVYKVVPPMLKQTGKVQNPWPNVDAHSGVMLQYYNIREMNFYTVMFGVSRCLGVMAYLIWDRALQMPIERPKSITVSKLMKMVDYNPDSC